MSLVFNAGLPPNSPQTHVLIVGVGDYPHLLGGSTAATARARDSFGLSQLTSPQVSAAAFANWLPKLTNRRTPLGTINLLLSPANCTDGAGNSSVVDLPTMANLKTAFSAWSQRCDANDTNIAIFYFCGHGLEKNGNSILLPCDFGNPAEANISANMIDFDLTYNCNLLECSAKTQIYLIDACRQTSTQLLALRTSPTALTSTTKLHQLLRDAPVIKATNSGLKAHAEPGKVSFYTQALLACLEKMGARGQNAGRWEIATSSLGQAMKYYLKRLTPSGLEPLICDVGGRSNFDTVIHYFVGTAYVMSSIDCEPSAALPVAQFFLRNGSTFVKSRVTSEPNPWELEVPAGNYDIEVKFRITQYVDKVCPQLMQPPFTPCTLEVNR